MVRDREEHLEWCKKRALEYLDRGEVANAIASMGSDLRKHEDFIGIVDKMMPLAFFYAVNKDISGARRWIEGFR
jgi:hypothetical protein